VPVAKVELVRDGEIVHTIAGTGWSGSLTWHDGDCRPGPHFYYAHILFEGEEQALPGNTAPACGVHAWSSPVWVTVS
jgi:hypothetical protein